MPGSGPPQRSRRAPGWAPDGDNSSKQAEGGLAHPSPAASEMERLGSSEISNSASYTSRGKHYIVQGRPKAKRPQGRPIQYPMDPDEDDTLTGQDKRKIHRRAANRESARRTRQKRQDGLKVMQDQVEAAQEESMALQLVVDRAEAGRHEAEVALTSFQNKLHAETETNIHLGKELQALRAQVEGLGMQPMLQTPQEVQSFGRAAAPQPPSRSAFAAKAEPVPHVPGLPAPEFLLSDLLPELDLPLGQILPKAEPGPEGSAQLLSLPSTGSLPIMGWEDLFL